MRNKSLYEFEGWPVFKDPFFWRKKTTFFGLHDSVSVKKF